MVGDVKQSIYKFRLAEPEIFKSKYALYALESEKNSIKIDLNNNFRSKRSVTKTVKMCIRDRSERYRAARPFLYMEYRLFKIILLKNPDFDSIIEAHKGMGS